MVLNSKWPKPDYSNKVRHQHIKILAQKSDTNSPQMLILGETAHIHHLHPSSARISRISSVNLGKVNSCGDACGVTWVEYFTFHFQRETPALVEVPAAATTAGSSSSSNCMKHEVRLYAQANLQSRALEAERRNSEVGKFQDPQIRMNPEMNICQIKICFTV